MKHELQYFRTPRSKVSLDFRSRCRYYINRGGFFCLAVARSMYQYAKRADSK